MKSIAINKPGSPWYIDIGLALLILLWLYTGLSKIFRHEHFVFQMGLSPAKLVSANKEILSWSVPIIELLIVAMLSFAKPRKLGLVFSILLLIVFEIYIISMLYNGHLPCACGGVVGLLGWKEHVVFNAVYLLIAIAVYFSEYPRVRKRE